MEAQETIRNLANIQQLVETSAQMDDFLKTFKAVIDLFDTMKADSAKERAVMKAEVSSAVTDLKKRLSLLQDGKTPTSEEILRLMKPLIPIVTNGKDADQSLVVQDVLAQMPAQREMIIDGPEEIRNKLELFTDEKDKLSIEAIGYLREELKALEERAGKKRTIATSTSLWHLSDVNVSGLAVGQSIKWDGTQWVVFTPASASGVTELTATETPNGSTTVFTFSAASAQPSYIVSDNVWMKATSKAGTVNWTWASGAKQATLTSAPQDDIYAIV